MNGVIDTQAWGAGTIAQAIHWLQGNIAVGGGLAELDTELLFGVRFELAGTHGLAGFRPADLYHMAAGRRAAKIMIETDNAVYLGAGELHAGGNQGDSLSRDIAERSLDGVQQWQQSGRHIAVVLHTLSYGFSNTLGNDVIDLPVIPSGANWLQYMPKPMLIQAARMKGEVVTYKRGDKEITVIVTGLHANGHRVVCRRTCLFQ